MSVRRQLAELNLQTAILIELLHELDPVMSATPRPKQFNPKTSLLQGRLEVYETVANMIQACDNAYKQLSTIDVAA